ncbi:MAG: methyltransferase domain-containing protein, partial [Cyanobacteria bacterium J06558_2]
MSQTWNAQQYINHASFVAEYGLPVLDLLNPQPGERILDLGCGDGALTSRIKSSGAEIYGVDSSASMIKTAQTRGLAAEVMNGEDLQFNNEFDAVFSNAALHWMTNIDHILQLLLILINPWKIPRTFEFPKLCLPFILSLGNSKV